MSGIYERIPAAIEEVERYAGEIPEAYLYCRVWHHSPEPHDIKIAKHGSQAVWSAILRCSNGCGVTWTVLVDPTGEVIKRKLDYSGAPDYILVGKGFINKEGNKVLRREFFTQKAPGTKSRRRKR